MIWQGPSKGNRPRPTHTLHPPRNHPQPGLDPQAVLAEQTHEAAECRAQGGPRHRRAAPEVLR